jgi:hypothetical protein
MGEVRIQSLKNHNGLGLAPPSTEKTPLGMNQSYAIDQ